MEPALSASLPTVEVENLSEIRRKLKIVVDAAQVTAELDRAYRDLGKRVRVKGFRPGKVPRPVLEMYYKKQVHGEVADLLIRRSLDEALRQQALEAVGITWPEPPPPLVAGEDFRYAVEVEVLPTFTPQGYKGLTLKAPPVTVTGEEVERRLEEIRQANAYLEPIKEARPIQEGDFVILDYQGYFAGEALAEARADNTFLEVGAGKFHLEFERHLLGLLPGATARFVVNLPPDFFNPLLAGKTIEFQVKIHEVKEKVVPPLDDAFAQSLEGDFQTVADLRQSVREDIIKRKERERRAKLEEQVLELLIAANPFEVPTSLVRREQERLLGNQLQFLQQCGLKMENLDLDAMLERLKPKAERQVRGGLILSRIAEEEKISVSEEELTQELARIAERSGRTLAQVEEFYRENNLLSGLRLDLRNRKVLDFIFASAEIITESELPAEESA